MSTPEYFTEVDKANYLLERGLSEQKAWVINSLPSLIREQGGELVLKKIIVTFYLGPPEYYGRYHAISYSF